MRQAGEFRVIRAERRLTKRQCSFLDRRAEGDRRRREDRRQEAVEVPSDRRSGQDRRVVDRREDGDRRIGERRNRYRSPIVLDEGDDEGALAAASPRRALSSRRQ
jgi:hypothetical protein